MKMKKIIDKCNKKDLYCLKTLKMDLSISQNVNLFLKNVRIAKNLMTIQDNMWMMKKRRYCVRLRFSDLSVTIR